MIELSLSELREGLTLARSIYRPSGEILLSQGFTLTQEVITRLVDTGQSQFWIQEVGLEHIIPEEILPDFLLNQAADELRQNTEHFRKKVKAPAQGNTQNIDTKALLKEPGRFNDALLSSRIIKIARTLVKDFKKNRLPYLLHLTTSRTQANYRFQHAADTAVVSIALGRAFQMEEGDLEILAVGAMLMDIGTALLPLNLIDKNDRFSFAEFCALKEHPLLGFEILRNDPIIPLICAHIAYQHHERQDGGGYPRRLLGTNRPPLKQEVNDKRNIHRFAEIVAVADEYMSLVKPKPFQPPKSPVEAIKFLLKSSGTQLNSAIVDTLIPMIPIFSVGTRIQLINASKPELLGATAVISKTNPERQDRPEITVIYDSNGNWIEHEIIDLKKCAEYAIQQISMPTASGQ